MSTRSEAEENLRTIRSLMERSTIYRAISAPTALVGGLLSVIACASFHFKFNDLKFNSVESLPPLFLSFWLITLVLTLITNTWFIWHGANKRSEPFISSGMKLALISLLPSMLCGVFATISLLLVSFGFSFILPPIWMLCYGLGLLSTSHFAPRSIVLLGWIFLIAGFGACSYFPHCFQYHPVRFYFVGNLFMGATFGLFHLIYAACTWPRKSATGTISGDEP